MPFNPVAFLPKGLTARLFPVPPPVPVPQNGNSRVQLNSGKDPTGQVDAMDRAARSVATTRVGSSTAAASAPAKAGDPLGWAAKATGFAVKTAGVLGGFGLVGFGAFKLLAAMATVSFPGFAAGVGLCVAGALAYKLGGIISKAITG